MGKLLTGKEVVASLNDKTRGIIQKLQGQGIFPTLAIVRVGEKPDDIAYENSAVKRGETVGVLTKKYTLPQNTSQEELVELIEKLNGDRSIHGVLLLRPLPAHMDDNLVRNTLSPKKDVDGITDASMAGIYSGGESFSPCTAEACMEILKFYGIQLQGKNAVVVGRSTVIGKPAAMLLLNSNATVTICHSKTKNLEDICKKADVVVAALGAPKFITTGSKSQAIIDVGINFDEDGKMCGDVDFEKLKDKVGAITPVPGGVGTVTNTVLMYHVALAAKNM